MSLEVAIILTLIFFKELQNDGELSEFQVLKVNDVIPFLENFDSVISCQKPFLVVLPSKYK